MATAITTAQLIKILDKHTTGMLNIKGTLASDYGIGDPTLAYGSDWGLSKDCRDILTHILGDGATVYGIAEPQIVQTILGAHQTLSDGANWRAITRSLYGTPLRSMDEICRLAGVILGQSSIQDINSFLSYYNYGAGAAGNPYRALLAPDFRDLYYEIKGAYPTALNVASPDITAGNAMGKRTQAGVTTLGTNVDTTKYAGAGKAMAFKDASWTGSGTYTITITGNGFNASGVAVTGQTWTASGVDATANAEVEITNASGFILTEVTAIAVTGTWTAGTLYVYCRKPTAYPYSPRIYA